MNLSKRIRQARTAAHLSQAALGRSVGVSDKAVSSYEKGRSAPSVAQLKRIAQTTRLPLAYFTEENERPALLASRLAAIEKEVAELKKLLKQSSR